MSITFVQYLTETHSYCSRGRWISEEPVKEKFTKEFSSMEELREHIRKVREVSRDFSVKNGNLRTYAVSRIEDMCQHYRSTWCAFSGGKKVDLSQVAYA